MKREIRYTYEKIAQPLELDTIYFGGGTPSLLEPDDFAEIIESVGATKNDGEAEISIELDPGTFDLRKLNQLKNDTPITRYSIGV